MKFPNLVPYIAAVAIGCGSAEKVPELPVRTSAERCDEASQTLQKPFSKEVGCAQLTDEIQTVRWAFLEAQKYCQTPPSEDERTELLLQRRSAAFSCPGEEELADPSITRFSVVVNKDIKGCEALATEVRHSANAVAALNVEDATEGRCKTARWVMDDASALMGSRYEVCKRTHSRKTIENMSSGPAARALSAARSQMDAICPRD